MAINLSTQAEFNSAGKLDKHLNKFSKNKYYYKDFIGDSVVVTFKNGKWIELLSPRSFYDNVFLIRDCAGSKLVEKRSSKIRI